jgi:4-amino-4-deoxy-L-arabinose transferase-like glycosyltransferase
MDRKQKIFLDIRFWIIFAFLLRLIGINDAPLNAHAWREVTVLMPVRNFLEIDANPFFPRVDFAGEKTGITGMEFPLLNYLMFLLAKVFGFAYWQGRIINLIITSIGAFYFYKIVKRFWQEKTAFYATLAFIFSLCFMYGRKIMPDTFSVSLAILAIYYATRYFLDGYRMGYLLLFGLFLNFAVLAKLPAVATCFVLSIFLFAKQFAWSKKILFIFVGILAILPSVFWYGYWVNYLVETYGFWHFYMGTSFLEGASFVFQNLFLVSRHFYEHALNFSGFALFLLGLYFMYKRKDHLLMLVFGLQTFVMFLFVCKAGENILQHAYYAIPYLPTMALLVGYGVAQLPNKWAYILIFILCIDGIIRQQHDLYVRSDRQYKMLVEAWVNDFIPPNDKVVVYDSISPIGIYFTHRKGWILPADDIQNQLQLSEMIEKGAKYAVVYRFSLTKEIVIPYETVFENEYIRIYSLKE